MILFIGYGVSGKAAMSLLRKQGTPAVAVDRKPEEGVFLDSADFPMEGISQVILSPGVLPSHPLVQKARAYGIEVVGEVEFSLRLTQNRCVGVTGSNGKTTTTLLIVHALKAIGMKARAVGNVGTALSSYLLDPDPEEILILELSSFQLETMRAKKLDAAVYLNLFPNHLDRHASMEEYASAKANIQHCLKPDGKLFLSSQVAQFFSSTQAEIFGSVYEHPELCPYLAQQNVCAAKAVATFFGVSSEQFQTHLPMFEKPPHRIEWVEESAGVRYYNDSKATSVEAVLHGLSFFTGPLIMIVGGHDKGSPYSPWIEAFRGKVKKIVAYGEASAKIQQEMEPFYSLERVSTLREAVGAANRSAKAGDTVLLCPGCSSYDQFENYEHRGNEFKKLVRETIGVDS